MQSWNFESINLWLNGSNKMCELFMQVYFGQNMVWKDYYKAGNGKNLKVGDPVFVLQKVSSADKAAA